MSKFFKNLVFSNFLMKKSKSKKLAYVSLCTAVLIVANSLLEFKFLDTQFSLTIFISAIAGIILGPLSAFCSAFLSDLLGYFISSWGMIYMPWVGLSVATTAFLSGVIFKIFKNKPYKIFIGACIFSVLSFLISTVAINSTGFYFYNQAMGFSTAVLSYSESVFGQGVSYPIYLMYRLIFKGQIFNSIFNYALLFISVLPLYKLNLFKDGFNVE